jgi:8-oxo-dGTP pyrophosphatase MutT (NUDIX family)
MNDQAVMRHIRAIAICVFRDGSRILVGDGYDPTKRELFYRPPGGGIHFGESSEAALRREIREELGVEIRNPRLLGVLENLFTFDSKQGHEIVFVYDAELEDRALYGLETFQGRESNGQSFSALWINLDSISPQDPPVYPEGLVELLRGDEQKKGLSQGSWARHIKEGESRQPV